MARDDQEISFGEYYTPGERLFLLYDYLLKYTNKDHVAKAKDIFAYLETFDIQISNKTLYIDIEKIRSTMKLDIEYNPQKWGYWVKNPPFEPYELRLLVDSIQSSKFITQEQARQISKKITELADVHTRASLNRQSYVANRVRSMNDSVVKDSDRIHECIALDSKVGFRYFHYTPGKEKQYSKSGTQYIVSPYALLWSDGNYYLYAFVSESQKFQHFRVDRMERIIIIPEKREGKDEFKKVDLTARQTKVFNMFSGKEYAVRLRCINRMADAIIDRFGKDTMLIPDGADHFTVSVNVEVSDQFYAWIASFGRRICILSPEPVAKGMMEFAQKIADMYKDKDEK